MSTAEQNFLRNLIFILRTLTKFIHNALNDA